jgi:hypothetical protein
MSTRTILVASLLLTCVAADRLIKPATRPTTRAAASQPARVRDSLVNGSVRYLIPKDWELVQKAENGMQASYTLPDGQGVASLLITQQETGVPHTNSRLRQQLVKYLLDKVAEDIKNRGADVVEAAKVEKDERFMARVRVRFRDSGEMLDVVHLFRGVGINLVNVTVAANSEDPAEGKEIHDAGALMLLSVTTGPPDRKK